MALSVIMKLLTAFVIAAVDVAFAQNIGAGSGTGYNASVVGTNMTTNATYSNPIMTLNAGDP
jgi:hypothetical protein